jgi:integrase
MAGKIRHLVCRDGRYFARIVVPVGLREVVGKTELRIGLGPDRKSALQKLPSAEAKLLDTLAEARRIAPGPRAPRRPLTRLEIAHLLYQELLERDSRARDVPVVSSAERVQVLDTLIDVRPLTVPGWNRFIGDAWVEALQRVASGEASDDEMAAAVGAEIEIFRERGATEATIGSTEWRSLARMIAGVSLEAFQRSRERDAGNESGRAVHPLLRQQPPQELYADTLPLDDLLSGYASELRRSGRGAEAERRWKPCFRGLIAFLKHDDARRLTRSDVLRWKDHLLASLAPKTVRDAYITGVKAVLQWAVDTGRLPSNPAASVKVRVPRKTQTRERGLSDAEARAVLTASLNYSPTERANPATRESIQMTAAKRWIPWLCAFSGARVAEIAQLRKSDIHLGEEIAHLRITPDAGSTKTGMFRDVPLHPQLIRIGFLDFVREAEDGPLFFSQARKRTSARHPSKQVAQRLAVWVRSLAVISPDIDPNHGWRHRLKTLARDHALDPRVIDAIQGHAPRSASDGYGDVSLLAKYRVIRQLPCYDCYLVTGR